MDPKPFRCVYDPELSQSKSQGGKAIFSRPKASQASEDPRRGKTKGSGKRAIPDSKLPLPLFAQPRTPPPSRRCLITGVGPLVSRVNLRDVVSQFGPVSDCQIVLSQTTGASLGIAFVVYDKGQANAAKRLVESSKSGKSGLDSFGPGIEVNFDADGTLLEQAKQSAEKAAQSQFVHEGSRHPAERDTSALKAVELRNLNAFQVSEWYEKFVGIDPTYLMIHDTCLSVKHTDAEDVKHAFRGFHVSHLAANRSGFYLCFENVKDALECYSRMHKTYLFGHQLRLLVTLAGKRYRHDEVQDLIHKQADEDLERRRNSSNASAFSSRSKTLRPGQKPQTPAVTEAAEQLLSELSPLLKKALWPNILSQFVTEIIERELVNRGSRQDENGPSFENTNEDSDSVGDSKESTPAAQGLEMQRSAQLVGFGARRGGQMGMTARAVPKFGIVSPWSQIAGMKIRKRASETAPASAPVSKKRKPLQATVSAPNSYVRAPIQQPALKEESPDSQMMEVEDETKDEMEDENEDEEDEEEELEEDMDALDLKTDDEETDDELRGMAGEASETSIVTTGKEPLYLRVQRLVKSPLDLQSLQKLLSEIPVSQVPEEEIYETYVNDFAPKLRLDPCNWPPPQQELPFRLSSYRNRNDDERREYLPNLGPGIPNEIVQNYKERPLYEGFEEIEQEESRTSTRALNVSRSAFGLNSDLFADDNLSKNAKDTRLARSAIHDWGLYANEAIPASDFVIEYVGDVLRDEYAEIRERHYALEGIDSTYLFRLDNGTVIDATKRGNGARFINHSCDPNCIAQVFDYEGFKRVVLFSLRDIELDEELTFDYNFVKAQDEDGKVRCACGSVNCRGWLM